MLRFSSSLWPPFSKKHKEEKVEDLFVHNMMNNVARDHQIYYKLITSLDFHLA